MSIASQRLLIPSLGYERIVRDLKRRAHSAPNGAVLSVQDASL
jgi:hypothetical protein